MFSDISERRQQKRQNSQSRNSFREKRDRRLQGRWRQNKEKSGRGVSRAPQKESASEHHLLLDFSHVYPQDAERQLPGMHRVDLSDIPGTDLYCTDEAREEIRRRIAPFGPRGIHFLDSGNYHYVTELFARQIQEPYVLVLFDHHTDMQMPLISELLSCGSWAGDLIRTDPRLQQLLLIGPEQSALAQLQPELLQKVVAVSIQDLQEDRAREQMRRIRTDLPVYLSIDKDVLDHCSARTNWDQGEMSLRTLEELIGGIFARMQVIGVDICGENSLLEPSSALAQDMRINRHTDEVLFGFLERYLQAQKNKNL